jgi:glutamate N-acetyltransferase/amino-acid N-acetyltransferase
MPDVAGARFATGSAGLRYRGRTDVLLVELAEKTVVAGVLTRSKTCSAPVDWCRKALKGGSARALIVNSGNANAFTGRAGTNTVDETVKGVAALMRCKASQVFVSSTGVIGEPLPATKLLNALPGLKKNLAAGPWKAAASAIMTTDTFPKAATRTADIDGKTVVLNGITKGSGMIAPDMATMLGYIFTDANVSRDALQEILSRGADRTYNCITVDSDTSTSDTVLAFATGAAGNRRVTKASDPRLRDFRRAFDSLLLELAHMVVKDGEGLSKFITITVSGAASRKAARIIGLAIANSPLVKTAIAGQDANWGRIVMAVGKAGEKADRDKLSIFIGGIEVAAEGEAVAGYDERPVAAHLKGREIDIVVDVGVGRGKATVWTCDLTHGYIDINADYRS